MVDLFQCLISQREFIRFGKLPQHLPCTNYIQRLVVTPSQVDCKPLRTAPFQSPNNALIMRKIFKKNCHSHLSMKS